jgi:hypothetical protein
MRLDSSGMKRRNREMIGRTKRARREALRDGVRVLVLNLQRYSPQDTRRYVRAWSVAGKDAGSTGFPMPEIKATSRKAEYESRLYSQLAAAEKRVKKLGDLKWTWYDSKPERAKTGYYNTLVKDLRRAEKRVEQAKEQIELANTSETFILIGGRKGKRGSGLATIRTKIYGGHGQILETSQGTAVRLVNKEPHAKIVERRSKSLRLASRVAASAVGVRTVSKKYLNEVTGGNRRP